MNPATRTAAHDVMSALTYGVEIETYGLGRESAAQIVAGVLGGTARAVGGYYDRWVAVAPDGREWTCMTDGSIEAMTGTEVVTPILQGDADMATLQSVIRALREAGAKSDAEHECGVHVHVGVGQFAAPVVGRIAKTVAKLDGFIRRACEVSATREGWCRALNQPTRQDGHVADVARIGRARTMTQLARAWYGSAREADRAYSEHYHGSRYHGLNLHSVFYKSRRTVEFRYFDGTLHAGKVRAFVTLAKAIVARSVVQSAASAKVREIQTRKQAMTLLTADLGMVGDAFAVVREHLVAAWPKEAPVAAPVVEAPAAEVAA